MRKMISKVFVAVVLSSPLCLPTFAYAESPSPVAFDEPSLESSAQLDSVVVYDSRLGSQSEAPIPVLRKPSSYAYYKTFYSNVTCKGSGIVSGPVYTAHVSFYVNVFFNSSGSCIGTEAPVARGVSGVVHTLSNPSVRVTSYSAHAVYVSASCKLTVTPSNIYTLTGTGKISV